MVHDVDETQARDRVFHAFVFSVCVAATTTTIFSGLNMVRMGWRDGWEMIGGASALVPLLLAALFQLFVLWSAVALLATPLWWGLHRLGLRNPAASIGLGIVVSLGVAAVLLLLMSGYTDTPGPRTINFRKFAHDFYFSGQTWALAAAGAGGGYSAWRGLYGKRRPRPLYPAR